MPDIYEDHIGLWADELRGWVPDTVFDAHVHVGPPEIVGEVRPERLKGALSTFMSLRWEELQAVYERLYSGKAVAGLIALPFPQREVDLSGANEYLIGLMKRARSVKGFMLSHPSDTAVTVADYEKAGREGVRFLGVKPYADRLGKSNLDATMPEFIPPDLLDFMNRERLIMMLHTSGVGVGDPGNQRFLRDVAGRFPDIRIILAHLGRYTKPPQFLDFLASGVLEECPSLYLEMSSCTNAELYGEILRREGLWDRLLFGSDLPFGLITGVERWSEARGPIFLARETYTWSDPAMDREFAAERERLTYNTYHVVKAFKDALDRSGIGARAAESLRERVFRRNAEALFAEQACGLGQGTTG